MASLVSEYKEVPEKGDLIKTDCICDDGYFDDVNHKVIKVETNGKNEDGSTCYTLRLECCCCGHKRIRPTFYNLYSKGEIV